MPAGDLLLYGQKKQKPVPSLKKNLFAYAADARWDELKPDARPARQGNSPSFIGLILAPADFLRAALPFENDEGNHGMV